MKNYRLILSCFLLGISGAVYGQLELKTPERFNYLTQGDALGANDSQFGSVGVTSGSAGPISDTAPLYPQSESVVLKRARIGNSFATGVPRYYLGDVVDQPAIWAPNGPGFWRSSPVRPGETFYNLNGANLVDVTGAQLPNTSGSSGTPIPALAAGAYEKFYYSPHANVVFATQAGTVEIWWVSALPQGGGGGAYVFKKETFNVSGAATGAVRKIFWTEKSFDGPRVNIPAGRIVSVNPIYNSNFPAEVAEEYKPVGYVENPDPNARPPAETRTLWFEQLNGLGQLAAYNQEGRIFVEYLGAEVAPGRHEFLGADVVEVVKAATIILETIDLGKQVLPKDGDTTLIGAPLFDLSSGSEETFYGTRALDNGKLVYFAERENLNPDLVVFYWLEVNDADISLLPGSEAPGLSIRWPKYQNRYFFVWPDRLDAYAHVTTYPDGSTAATGIEFDPANQPEIIFQDDPAQNESSFDPETQRLIIDLSASLDGWNRTLLKFTNGNQVWYQPVYSQYEDRSETLVTTVTDAATTTILTVGSTAGIEVGGIFAKLPDYSVQVVVESILDGQRLTVGTNLFNDLRIPNGPEDYDYYLPPSPYTYFGTYNAVSKTVTTQKSLTVPDTDGLTVGTLVTGPGINGTATIESIASETEITLSQDLLAGSYELTYRVESDSTPPINSTATVGNRIERPSDRYSLAGAVSGGTGYQASAYLDPYSVGVEAAEAGAIIPVNALPTDDILTVRWFQRIEPPVPGFSAFYVPSKVGHYTVSYPEDIGNWNPTGSMTEERYFHSATRLKDGRILVAGGSNFAEGVLASAEIYDPSTRTWTLTAPMNTAAYAQGAVLLADGKVLVAGGGSEDNTRTEIFDPGTETWTSVSPMSVGRIPYQIVLLSDGKVMVAGGANAGNALSSTEIFDPATGYWSTVGALGEPRRRQNMSILDNGKVLIVGGDSGIALGSVVSTTAEIYDPATQMWSYTGSPGGGRLWATSNLLPTGEVLLIGGTGASPVDNSFNGITDMTPVAGSSNPFFFDGVDNAWKVNGSAVAASAFLESPVLTVGAQGPVTMTLDHSYDFEATFDGGRLLVSRNGDPFVPVEFVGTQQPSVGALGGPGWSGQSPANTISQILFYGFAGDTFQIRLEAGWDASNAQPDPNWTVTGISLEVDNLRSAQLYNPSSGTWSATSTGLLEGRYHHSSTVMTDGKVLVVGGYDTGGDNAELYDPLTGVWAEAGTLGEPRGYQTATLMDNGNVLITGGVYYDNLRTAEVLQTVSQVVMASNLGTADLTPSQAAGFLYQENDFDAVGYNPNEEHGIQLNGRFYALRDDLNVTTGGSYTSEPFLLVAYTNPDDNRPAMRPFRIIREDTRYTFNYPWTAGTKIQGPMPLPLMQLPVGNDGLIANTEVPGIPDPAPDLTDTAPVSYDAFTFEDRQGYKWVYRGPHAGGIPTLGMQWYYPMQVGFYIPGATPQPAEGTTLPYLRPLDGGGAPQGDPVTGTSLTVSYTPTWPENPPSLRISETLTLPKFGLPDVRNQKSADVLYQQSIARLGDENESVILHDPTRNKSVKLLDIGLPKIPASIRTSNYQGKTYFQGLPPHLQTRFFLDPLASANGSLVLSGVFHDEIAGEDYLDLNVLSVEDELALKKLAENEESGVQSLWDAAIDALNTRLETFIEDPSRKGTYIVSNDPLKTFTVGAYDLPEVPDADTARDSYALTASGRGDGFVTLFFSNGMAPNLTPQGDPPVMQIIKVIPELYNGDLKVLLSNNPLDEQVNLRHSGDFAAKPENFEFEWRYASPQADGTQPPTYQYTAETYLGDTAVLDSRTWRYVSSPPLPRPTADSYSAAGRILPQQIVINALNYDADSGLPGIVLKAQDAIDFSAGIPTKIVFSADTGNLDGFVLYVNGAVALVHGNDVQALDDLLSENAYDLRLIRVNTVEDIPSEGEKLVVLAEVASSLLHFRIFDAAGTMVVDTDEALLSGKSTQIQDLKARLATLWSTTNLLTSDKIRVVDQASSIVEFSIDRDASTGLSPTGLEKQFSVSEAFFLKGLNTIEVALYSESDLGAPSNIDFRLEGSSKLDRVDPTVYPQSPWQKPSGSYSNRITVGGSPTAPLGSPLLVLSDNYFTMRYRAKEFLSDGVTPNPAYTLTNQAWSNWTRASLVEGWIKRVLAAINPFNQRIKDLFNNAVNTDVSLLTQAGAKWEGDIALTLDAINDFGLIAIYETVLNRGKEISIESGYDFAPANDALLLAAGYLHDLYTILGNEGYADAANPTISIDDQDTITEVNTSRFSFEGQVASVLEEELALLRGRDDFLAPQVTQSPFYNRLFWNYTRGINSGEALYAVNYNIKEKVGSSTENGSIDAADAQRMFPQGHGDAYGHYLTAIKGYYSLLTNPSFTWIPRTEALNILNNTVSVDYQDERKFAEAAANIARTAEQVVALTHRQQYRNDPAEGWEQFRDGKVNPNTPPPNKRYWGLDEWISRSAQGSYYHWVVGNAMIPDVDSDHTGIQKIDRTTVPELELLAISAESLQATADSSSAHLNPLGLSPGAIAFDIDPAALKDGNSHYEQVYQRALTSVLNAKGSFDQAATMTRLLRNQENQIDDFNTAIEDEERAFNYELIDLYGSPYPGDVGPGKTYSQGYNGPDLINWYLIDRPSSLVDMTQSLTIEARVPVNIPSFDGLSLMKLTDSASSVQAFDEVTIRIQPVPFGQFADQWAPGVDLGRRSITGKVQQALVDAQLAYLDLQQSKAELENDYAALEGKIDLMLETIDYHQTVQQKRADSIEKQKDYKLIKTGLEKTAKALKAAKEFATTTGISASEFFPKANGFSNDMTSTIRGTIKTTTSVLGRVAQLAGLIAEAGAAKAAYEINQEEFALVKSLENLGFSFEQKQLAYELEVELQEVADRYFEAAKYSVKLQQAVEELRTVMAHGDRIQLEREIFRKRGATVVQGYRTKDLTFRTFRNEALEQYRTLFDLAARYTYLAANSYDYETGLLGTTAGQAAISKIVSSRSLGDLTNGQPQATVSTLGDAGLAGTMAQLQADWSVAEGRLGINNPDQNGTLFSLRQELFRIMDDPDTTDDDDAWQQVLEQHMVSDIMADPDAAAYCRGLGKPDGSPVPGIVISFSTTIEHGKNFFGLPLAGGDHTFSASTFATKIYAVSAVFEGYIGMDPYAEFIPIPNQPVITEPNSNDPNALSATPYMYLIPTGVDKMRAPPLGDTGETRFWVVKDQALPLPYNLGANAFSTTQFFDANGTLTEQPWILRKHQAFRAVDDPVFFYSGLREEFQSSRLVGRSVWNTGWKIIIPAYALLNDEEEGLNRFAASVDDIKIFLRTYSNSGN